MKTLNVLVLVASLGTLIAATGCEVSHSETDKPGLLGGHKHEETTTTKNPLTGETSTSHTETKTN